MNELSLLDIQPSTTYEQAREIFKTKLSVALARDNASAVTLCAAWEKVKREHFKIEDNSQRRYVSDNKLKISMPVYILSRGHYGRLKYEFESIGDRRNTFDAYLTANLNESARAGFPPLVAPSEINSPEFFNILAQRTNLYLSYCASCYPRSPLFQVGLDNNEAYTIVNQHSWYKRFSGHGAVTLSIQAVDLNRKQSEQEHYGPGLVSARSYAALSLNANCKITPEEILRWDTNQYYPYSEINVPSFLINQPHAAARPADVQPAPANSAGVSNANPFANYFGLFLRALWQVEPERNAPQAQAVAQGANDIEADDIILPGNAPAQAEVKVFEGIIDPVTFELIDKAVTTCSGWTYNESTILRVLDTNRINPTDPMSRASLLGAEAYRVNHTVTSLARKEFNPTTQARDVPPEFIDSFSKTLIRKPVLAEDGYCYDADALKSACQKPGNHDGMIISPRDGRTLIGKSLFIDRTIIALLDEYHAHRTDNVENLLLCFPEEMNIAQLLDAIKYYSEIIDVESGRKMRNFYLADRLLRLLEIKADSAEEKVMAKLRRGNLDFQHAKTSGVSKKESAARALLCLSQALGDLLSINNFSQSDQLIALIDSFCKAEKELFALMGNKKSACLEFVNLELLQLNITKLSDIISDNNINPRQKLYRIQETLQQKTLVMFDYDGTLVTIGVPKRAITDKALLKQMLLSLIANPNVTVAICSKQGQEKRTAKSVEPSMEEFLLKELELSAEDVGKVQLYGMEAYNNYMRAEAGKPADSIVPFKVAMTNKIYREKAGFNKFIYVNDSMFELEEMQNSYREVIAVPVLLNATTNHLINNDIFNGLITREHYQGIVDASVITPYVKLEEVWKTGYATEYAVSRETRNKEERHMHCAAAGYFLMAIEVLRAFIDTESRARDKSPECIRLATKLIHELAQINPRELTPTAMQGYLNSQLSMLKRQVNGHRLVRWLIVVVDQIRSGFLAQREFIVDLEKQEESLRAELERKANELGRQRQQLSADLVKHLEQQFPGFTCQFIAQLNKYKNPNATNDNFRLNPDNVFKDCIFSPACIVLKDAFIQAALEIKRMTQFDATSAALPAKVQFDGKVLTQAVLNKIFTAWEAKKKSFDEQQSKASGVTAWFATKQDNPQWIKPAAQHSLIDWLQSINDYLKQCKNISKDHPAVNLMEVCHEIFALPVARLGHDKVNEFVGALEKRINELRQSIAAMPK